jgi:hypothetical protein
MTKQDFIDSTLLGNVILQVITIDPGFKVLFKEAAPSIAADIESASSNVNCSCRNAISTYVSIHKQDVGSLLYDFAIKSNILQHIEAIFNKVSPTDISGKVAKTSIKDWPDFVKGINESKFGFNHMSTSIVGDDVYVFFM